MATGSGTSRGCAAGSTICSGSVSTPFGGRAWTWDEKTAQWYLHLFLAEQPDLNWRNPEVQSAMQDTLRFWLDRGVDGFRIDVIHGLVKPADFPDTPSELLPMPHAALN